MDPKSFCIELETHAITGFLQIKLEQYFWSNCCRFHDWEETVINGVYVAMFRKQDFKFKQNTKIFSSSDHSTWVSYDEFNVYLNMCLSEAWKLELTNFV
jgi:hypothetical protein